MSNQISKHKQKISLNEFKDVIELFDLEACRRRVDYTSIFHEAIMTHARRLSPGFRKRHEAFLSHAPPLERYEPKSKKLKDA